MITYNYYRNKYFMPIKYNDEVFMDIDDKYSISNYGNVYNKKDMFLVSQFSDNSGYKYCKLYEINKLVHRLVLCTFNPIENFNLYDVNHINGRKYDNRLCNLEWSTRSENIIHAFNHNLAKQAESHPNSIYSDNFIKLICEELEKGNSYKDICINLNIEYDKNTCNLLYKIKNKKLWKSISKNYNF